MRWSDQIKTHHALAFMAIGVGLSFIFEQYTLRSLAMLGPVSLLQFLPWLHPFQWWGVLFLAGGLGILFAPNVWLRAIFLALGASSWAVFAGASLYESVLGEQASTTGSLVGIVFTGLVWRFIVAIKLVSRDFTKRKDRARVSV
jgi:hypothetical protein